MSQRQKRKESDRPAAADRGTSESHSVVARQGVRDQLAQDVEAFLADGGSIEEVPKDYRADPPKRPESSYGRGSI